jgi:hypothetical protein
MRHYLPVLKAGAPNATVRRLFYQVDRAGQWGFQPQSWVCAMFLAHSFATTITPAPRLGFIYYPSPMWPSARRSDMQTPLVNTAREFRVTCEVKLGKGTFKPSNNLIARATDSSLAYWHILYAPGTHACTVEWGELERAMDQGFIRID